MTRHDRALTLLTLVTLIAPPSTAEVLHGTATIEFTASCGLYQWGSAIDVNSLTTVDYWSAEADLALGEWVNYCGRYTLWLSNGGLGAMVGGSLEELTTAPEPTTIWVMNMPFDDQACVLKTTGGLYVKFAVRAIREPVGAPVEADIEYYVQTDGTPVFGPTVPVSSTTWGKVKALYR